jgi:hypothetical protein
MMSLELILVLHDLDRIERLVLRTVRSAYFRLPTFEPEADLAATDSVSQGASAPIEGFLRFLPRTSRSGSCFASPRRPNKVDPTLGRKSGRLALSCHQLPEIVTQGSCP